MTTPRIESARRSTSYSVNVTPPLFDEGSWIVNVTRNRWWPNGGQEAVSVYRAYVLHEDLPRAINIAWGEVPGIDAASMDPIF